MPSTAPLTRWVMKSIDSSGPPRFKFHPRSSPPHLPASMMRSRRNDMFVWRWDTEIPATRRSGYFAEMQLIIAGPLLEAQEPPPPPGAGEGLGLGEGAGAAGVLNACVALHALVVSPSVARERQNSVALA